MIKKIGVIVLFILFAASSVFAQPAPIWETGQKASYYTGDDGDLERGVPWPGPRFADHGNGTVTDNLTGLMWTKSANLPNGYRTWQQALDYVSSLNASHYLGYTDWRLPNRKELFSLIDHSRYNPALPADHPFTNVQASRYWSSTTGAGYPDGAWIVHMWDGNVNYGYKSYNYYHVWPVRSGQCGSFGNLDHFEFLVISSPQAVGVPFSVTITAKDGGGNTVDYDGSVSLWSDSGAIYPTSVYLTNGTWAGNVIVYDVGSGIHLSAIGGGKTGLSNSFNVQGISNYGSLEGEVRDGDKNMVNGATVTVSQTKGGTPIVQTASVNGIYRFDSVDCGTYYVWAEKDGKQSAYNEVTVICRGCVTEDLIIAECSNPDGRIPILLVPGIMGSCSKNHLYFMPSSPPSWDSGKLEILDLNFGWEELSRNLRSNGYRSNCTLFDVPYYWPFSNADSAKIYLKPWIDEAKRKAGTDKVNIVSHSMGGLVTRAYIESSDYEDDINKFAMVGTPNHGAANSYYLWEGGDPVSADNADGFWDVPIYTLMLGYLMYGAPGVLHTPLTDLFYYLNTYDYIHDHLPSAKQLMPTYDFLVSNGVLQCEKNVWLDDLNKNPYLSERMGSKDDTTKIRTKIFIGNNTDTVGSIWVGKRKCSSLFYPDGEPRGVGPLEFAFSYPNGDGTVLTSSAILGNGISYDASKTGEHCKLISVYKDDIVAFMTSGEPSPAPGQAAKSLQAELPTSSLSISVNGRIQFYIASPAGQESGIKNDTRVNDIPETTVSVGPDAGTVTVENPSDGTYTVYLTGLYNEDFGVILGYSDTSKNIVQGYHGFNHAGTISFTVTINSASDERVTVNHTPLLPTGIHADAVDSGGLKTLLSWDLSTDPNVMAYNIYAKAIDEPYLAPIGTSITNSFDTGDPWAENSSVTTRIYAVSAVKADGTESFLSNTVTNNDRDHDGLTDAQEIALGTDMSNPDSDGDGLNDGEEYLRGTNPLLADTDGDGYSDYAEVQNGTDPLDPDSPPTYSITGAVTGDVKKDVTMTLSGTISKTTTTDSAGTYSFTGLIDGEYTVTPSKLGYSFTPPSTNVTVSGANVTGVNFVASVPTLIGLSSFTATPSDRAVILKWTTASEIDNAGFNLYRSETEGGEYMKINPSLIPAEGSPTSGATYQCVDNDVKNRRTYYYKLEDIDLNGKSTMHGPMKAVPRRLGRD